MKQRELINLGIPRGVGVRLAQDAVRRLVAGAPPEAKPTRADIRAALKAVVEDPASHTQHPVLTDLARLLAGELGVSHTGELVPVAEAAPELRDPSHTPVRVWGEVGTDIDQASVDQLQDARRLPIARAAALMPDAHLGYGLPIGGVLACDNAVIPYAVGVDIACRVRLSVLDLPASTLDDPKGIARLRDAIDRDTRFGVGAQFGKHGEPFREHPVMDADWSVSPVTQEHKDRARRQLGTSGSGNHFVDVGVLSVPETDDPAQRDRFTLTPGTYLAVVSHSGSRGPGAAVCNHYSGIAASMHPLLKGHMSRLAWLGLDTEPGQEYFAAMNLMGEFASANHACIHESLSRTLGAQIIASVENHHNFAWKETHTLIDLDGGTRQREVIVHRKGATPAGPGELGVIPGSMAQPTYIVRGLGGEGSLNSASHGAGRLMSRSKAKRSFRWSDIEPVLRRQRVEVMSAGIDENPKVYKDIDRVLALQRDLAVPIARFDPRLVKMAPEGERAED